MKAAARPGSGHRHGILCLGRKHDVGEEYLGREVSAQALLPLYDALIQDGHDPAALPARQQFREPVARLQWAEALQMLREAERRFSDEALKAIGRDGLRSGRFRWRTGLARRLLTPEDAFRFIIYPHADVDFACLLAAVESTPGDICVTVLVEDGYDANEAFFLIMLGAAEAFLESLSLDGLQIEATHSRHDMTYRARYQPANALWSPFARWGSNLLRRVVGAFTYDAGCTALSNRALALRQTRLAKAHTEAQLRATHARLQDTLALAGGLLLEFGPGNRVEHLSGPAEAMTGFSPAAIRSDPAALFAQSYSAIARFDRLEPLPSGTTEMSWRHRDGHRFDVVCAVEHHADERWRLLVLPKTAMAQTAAPIAPAAPEPIPVAAAPAPAQADPHSRLVFVDDSALSCRIGKGILEHAGYSVVCSQSGPEVLSYLATADADAVILDLNMPEMRGDEVYDELHAQAPELPVIFLTGDAHDLTLRYPNVPVLHKPFRANELLRAVAGVGL